MKIYFNFNIRGPFKNSVFQSLISTERFFLDVELFKNVHFWSKIEIIIKIFCQKSKF